MGTISKNGKSIILPSTECSTPLRWCTLYGNLQLLILTRHAASGGNITIEFENFVGNYNTGISKSKLAMNSTSINQNNTITFSLSWYIDNTQSASQGAVYYHSLKQ